MKRHHPTSSLVLATLRASIYISILSLFFIFAYVLIDFLRLDAPGADVDGRSIEEIVAVFAQYDSAEFAKELARKLALDKSIVGDINLLERGSDGRLHLVGWALDTQDSSESFDIFLIVPQTLVMMSSTGLRRDDVTDHFGLANETAYPGFDAVFENRFDCDYNKKDPFVLAVSRTKQFSLIKPWVQVSGC